ncbi:hypothetical protein CH275_09415 [Rhodococcus sp. 06-235-1A]|uniref:hypothetical protein n=1 Tax=Rhodococcus sp. 06-235-1A TaxID=2022508 RepID=UPI000B9B17E5|nr:hypothetical protein [Rhodococcus sp. 06-235-1A]OZD06434.1 hypothetical protein CH275_09415 [Rhodococcus sp. 06-235-1A]
MSVINPRVAFAVPMFLEALTLIELGQPQPAEVLEHPKMMATTVLSLLSGGDDALLGLGDLALGSLARAAIALCDAPTESGAVAAYRHALEAWDEINTNP